MNKKKIFITSIFTIAIALAAFGLFGAFSQARGANTPNDWSGSWQMGPSVDTNALLGCPTGNGLARITAIYYPEQDRVYFLGARCEDNNTYGQVFYFDPVTQTFATTGAVMQTPVSNYQVVRIDDDGTGNGPGLYIVGGRTQSGGQSSAVQVYYPNNNTVGTIATDPFPPAVPYSPGGVVVNGGKIYVFGGFDGTNMYPETYIYDPAGAAGSRWTNSGCNLPTGRSYITAVSLGTKVYSIGGDEIPTLTPINDTEVLETTDLGSCWQDALMADLPAANGDAPGVYVDENYIGGGIFMIGGSWPAPGPDRWVFRYDVAGDFWEYTPAFPALAIPAPATGRRNQAAVYIPAVGDRVPALWTFGGYDGSGTNAMTETSEFFANLSSQLLLNPDALEVAGLPGATVTDNFTLVNQSPAEDSFDISYTSDVTWTVGLPVDPVGPVAGSGGTTSFPMTVDIPAGVDCGVVGSFTITAEGVANPALTASSSITVRTICGVSGKITDINTGLGIPNAYVWVQEDPNGLVGAYKDGYTNADGKYLLSDVVPGFYYFAADAMGYQPSFYPEGWPAGAITFTLGTQPVVIDAALIGSAVSFEPASVSVGVLPGQMTNETLTISNTGSGPYYYNISLLDGSQPEPPAGALAIPDLPRVDTQIFSDISASPNGTTDFVVVLNGQADVSAAYGIADWNARGQAVYDKLSSYASKSQKGLISYLDSQGVDYQPLYIINAVIVHAGNTTLVNDLAARQDVAQLVANHKIAVEQQPGGIFDALLKPVTVPEAVEWGVAKIKADQVWSTYSVKGEGVVVAEIDTGTQFDHPALVNQYRGTLGGGTYDHNYNWYDPYFQCPDTGETPCDPGGHGTHVMGTMVGDDGGANQIGVAPGAKWISCKGGDAVSGYLLTNELLVCAQWILAPTDLGFANPDPAMRPNVVNNSWGGGPNDYWYTGAVSAWRAAGIFPAFANGNAGPQCSTAHSPGDYWNSFASGASDDTDAIANFSSRGPAAYTGFLKPNITSPGVSIRSSVPGNGYAYYNGTSMASPHTAGAVALLYSAAPELVGQVDLTGWVLEQTATPLLTNEGCGGDLPDTHPNNTFGYGLLNVLGAVNLAKNEQLTPNWVSVDPQGGVINPGESTTINLTFTGQAPGVYNATLWLVGDDPYNNDVRIPLTMNVWNPFFLPLIHK
jgi:subtilisin family serine protease